jgi:outer membrane murein-binding lipoprotein Lpp
MSFSPRPCVAVAAALLSATLVTGCGGTGTLTAQEYPAAAEQLVSAPDLGRLDPGSPGYAVLAWWRDAQFSDLSGYLSHLSRGVRLRLSAAQVERQLPILAGGIRTAKPRILSTEVVGDSATVYTKIVFRQPIGATRYVTTTRPQAFHLVLARGVWRLSDTYFADSITAAALKAAETAKS